MSGKVYLVGGGPGDPDLLTVKAARLLKTADAVLHDDLVSAEVLGLIGPGAQVHNVGKRCGRKKIRQEEINFLMVTLAASGLNVVRLKSGDPLIFGRVGEEISALRKANIEYEIVPGVTSAFGAAAAANIPLTDRRTASALLLVTGQHAPGNSELDWSRFASSGVTIAVYMPGSNYSQLAKKIRSAGWSGQTPCAIISRATTSAQRIHQTTLGELPFAVHLPAPALLLVGEVVHMADVSAIEGALDSCAQYPNFHTAWISRSANDAAGADEEPVA